MTALLRMRAVLPPPITARRHSRAVSRTLPGDHRSAVADSVPCSPRSAFSTVTGIRCPSPLA